MEGGGGRSSYWLPQVSPASPAAAASASGLGLGSLSGLAMTGGGATSTGFRGPQATILEPVAEAPSAAQSLRAAEALLSHLEVLQHDFSREVRMCLALSQREHAAALAAVTDTAAPPGRAQVDFELAAQALQERLFRLQRLKQKAAWAGEDLLRQCHEGCEELQRQQSNLSAVRHAQLSPASGVQASASGASAPGMTVTGVPATFQSEQAQVLHNLQIGLQQQQQQIQQLELRRQQQQQQIQQQEQQEQQQQQQHNTLQFSAQSSPLTRASLGFTTSSTDVRSSANPKDNLHPVAVENPLTRSRESLSTPDHALDRGQDESRSGLDVSAVRGVVTHESDARDPNASLSSQNELSASESDGIVRALSSADLAGDLALAGGRRPFSGRGHAQSVRASAGRNVPTSSPSRSGTDVSEDENEGEEDPAMSDRVASLSPIQKAQLCSFVPRKVWSAGNVLHQGKFIDEKSEDCCVLLADLSGFTAMSERLASEGERGIETLSQTLNTYLGMLCDVVDAHGGDVIKFAGDALLCTFQRADNFVEQNEDRDERSNPASTLSTHAILATQASMRMHAAVSQFNTHLTSISQDTGIELSQLTIHNALAIGTVHFYRVYAYHHGNKHAEFLINGEPLQQVAKAHLHAKQNQTVVSKQMWSKIKSHFEGFPVGEMGDVRVDSVTTHLESPGKAELNLDRVAMLDIIKFIPEAVLAAAETDSLQFCAELRQVTVVFTMLHAEDAKHASSVKLSEAQRAYQAIAHLTQGAYKGMIRQFIVDDKGCVVITAFGVPPRSSRTDAYRGLSGAIEGVRQILKLGIDLEASAGVATGTVYCGAVGSERRREFAVVGDTVNLAARLAGKSRKGEVLCDDATRREVSGKIPLKTLPAIRLKGKSELVRQFSHRVDPNLDAKVGEDSFIDDLPESASVTALLRPDSGSESSSSLASGNESAASRGGALTTIFGRSLNLTTMNTILEQAISDFTKSLPSMGEAVIDISDLDTDISERAFLASITGETGYGKSTLVSAWETAVLTAEYGGPELGYPLPGDFVKGKTILYSASCDEVMSKRPYNAFGTMLCQLLGISTGRSVADLRDQVTKAVGLLDPALTALVPLLEAVLQLGFKDSVVTDLFNETQRIEKIVEVVLRLFLQKSRSTQRLLVLLIDNFHWLDPSSKHLLVMLLRHFPLPVMLVLAKQPQPGNIGDLTEVSFPPMRRVDILLEPFRGELLREAVQHLVGAECPQAFFDYIQENSRGVPLLVKQLTMALRDNDVYEIVTSRGGTPKIRIKQDLESAKLPQSVKSIVIARFDKLSSRLQIGLKTAVVIASGAVAFSTEHMSQAADISLGEAKSRLTKLLSLGLVENPINSRAESDASQMLYTVPLLIQSVVYDLMLRSQRELLHERCAHMYESFGGDSSTYVLQLAHHWRQTRDKLRASDFTWKAVRALEQLADRQVREYANQEAWSCFDTALDLVRNVPDSPERDVAQLKLLQRAVPVVVSASSWKDAGSYIDDAAVILQKMQSSDQSFEGLERPFMKLMASLAMQTGYIRGNQSQFSKYVEEANNFILKLGNPPPDLVMQVHHMNWTLYFADGRYVEALAEVEAGICIYEQDIEEHSLPTNYFLGHDAGLCGYFHRALLSYVLADFAKVRAAFSQLRVAVKSHRHLNSCSIANALGLLAMSLLGDTSTSSLDVIIEVSKEVIEIGKQESLPFSVMIATACQAWAEFYKGDEPDQAVEKALSVLQRAQFLPFRPPLVTLIGDMLLDADRNEEAEQTSSDTLEKFESSGFHYFSSELRRIRGEAMLRRANNLNSATLRGRGTEDLRETVEMALGSHSAVFALAAHATALRCGLELVEAQRSQLLDLSEGVDPSEPKIARYLKDLEGKC